jgi:hypothetical protein
MAVLWGGNVLSYWRAGLRQDPPTGRVAAHTPFTDGILRSSIPGETIPTVLVGFFLLFCVTDRPQLAHWLKDDELAHFDA